jgi:hypothetical protein
VNIDLMRVTCLDIDIEPTPSTCDTTARHGASDDLSDDDMPHS